MNSFSLQKFQIISQTFTIYASEQQNQSKEKIETLENELLKSNILLKKKDFEINNLQKIISQQRKTSNNTSNSLLLSSEFKKEWNDLGSSTIMESFEHVFNRSTLLAHMVQETFLITFTETQKLIDQKVSHIMSYFNISQKNCKYEKFFFKIIPIFEEFFVPIFFDNQHENEILVNNILSNLSKNIIGKNIAKYFHKEILLDLQSENIKKFINKSIKLSLYMHLHSPILTINIDPFDQREYVYYYFNHCEHVNIEGFEKDNSPCLVILPPPLLNSGFSFMGIKPFVYIIADPDEKIYEKCEMMKEQNIEGIERRIHSKSYGGEDFKERRIKKEEDGESSRHSEEIQEEEVTESKKKRNLSDRSPDKKDNNLFTLSSSSSSSLKGKDKENREKEKVPSTKKEEITEYNVNKAKIKKINSRNASKEALCYNNKTTINNTNISVIETKTQFKEMNRISQILFNIGHPTTLNTPPSSASSSLTKRKIKKNLPPNFKKKFLVSVNNGINASSSSIKSRNTPNPLNRNKTHQQSFSLNKLSNNPLMGNGLSFFEKEGGNYDYICKTIEQKENGVMVKPIIKQIPQELNVNSEKQIKKRKVHIINQNIFPSCKAKRYEENNNSNSINKKSKNNSVKFSKKKKNIENCCLNMNTINTNLINKGLVKGVINRNYIKTKKTFFTNDLLSCYNNNHILNNNSVNINELNGNDNLKQKIKGEEGI